MNDTTNNGCGAIGETSNENVPTVSNDTTDGKKKLVGIYGLQNKVKPEKWYVGQSNDIEDRWNTYRRLAVNRQPKLMQALIKYGYDGFEKVILETCNESDLDRLEDKWMVIKDSINAGYNIRAAGSRGRHSADTKRKMSESAKNIPADIRRKMVIAQIGKHHTEETRRKLSEISKHMSAETKQKMSLAAKRRIRIPFSDEHRRNLSKALSGRHHTDETKRKISELQRGNRPWARELALKMSAKNVGRKQSPETIAKRMKTMSENRLKKLSEVDIAH